MKKRIVSIILAMVVTVAYSVPCFAGNEDGCYSKIADSIDISSFQPADIADTDFEDRVEVIESIEGAEVENVQHEIITKDNVEAVSKELLHDEEIGSIEEEGSPYTVTTNDEGIAVINTETKEYTVLSLDDNGNLNVKMIEKDQNNVYTENSMTVEAQEEDVIFGQGWTKYKVVKETYKNKYWYHTSDSGAYLKVGCSATYKINYDELPNSKADKVRSYKTNVKSARDKYNEYESSLAAFEVSATIATAAIIAAFGTAFETFGVSLLVGLLVGLVADIPITLATKAIINLVGAKKAYNNARSLYSTVKTYGKKC